MIFYHEKEPQPDKSSSYELKDLMLYGWWGREAVCLHGDYFTSDNCRINIHPWFDVRNGRLYAEPECLSSLSNRARCGPWRRGAIWFKWQFDIVIKTFLRLPRMLSWCSEADYISQFILFLSNHTLYLFSLPCSRIHTLKEREIRNKINGQRCKKLHFLFALMNYWSHARVWSRETGEKKIKTERKRQGGGFGWT